MNKLLDFILCKQTELAISDVLLPPGVIFSLPKLLIHRKRVLRRHNHGLSNVTLAISPIWMELGQIEGFIE